MYIHIVLLASKSQFQVWTWRGVLPPCTFASAKGVSNSTAHDSCWYCRTVSYTLRRRCSSITLTQYLNHAIEMSNLIASLTAPPLEFRHILSGPQVSSETQKTYSRHTSQPAPEPVQLDALQVNQKSRNCHGCVRTLPLHVHVHDLYLWRFREISVTHLVHTLDMLLCTTVNHVISSCTHAR